MLLSPALKTVLSSTDLWWRPFNVLPVLCFEIYLTVCNYISMLYILLQHVNRFELCCDEARCELVIQHFFTIFSRYYLGFGELKKRRAIYWILQSKIVWVIEVPPISFTSILGTKVSPDGCNVMFLCEKNIHKINTFIQKLVHGHVTQWLTG